MIRTSRREDLEQIMDIWLTSNLSAHHFVDPAFWHSNYEAVKEAISEGVLVYEEECRVVGFIGVSNGYVAGLFVKEDRRGNRIGKALLDNVKSNAKTLTLHVFEKNTQAIHFYEREGFCKKEKIYNEDCKEIEYTMEWTC